MKGGATKDAAKTAQTDEQNIAVNRRAFHDYQIDQRIEAGLILTGTEIKAIRAGHVNLREAYARIERGEAWLWNAHIAPYEQGNRYNHEPTRTRKLLLHRREIDGLARRVRMPGYTLVPLRLYLRRNRAKIELGLARGKKEYDKRDAIAERDAQRDVERALRERRRS
jgi:SsrA-binding protein